MTRPPLSTFSLTSRILQHLCHKLNHYSLPCQILARLDFFNKIAMFMYLKYITAQYSGSGDKIFLQLNNIARLRREYIESNQVHWRPDWPMVDYCSHRKLDCLVIHCNELCQSRYYQALYDVKEYITFTAARLFGGRHGTDWPLLDSRSDTRRLRVERDSPPPRTTPKH